MKMQDLKLTVIVLALLTILGLSACGKEEEIEVGETYAQQVGAVMAAIDESGGSTGSFALLHREQRHFAKVAPSLLKETWLKKLFSIPQAQASCSATWGSCTNNILVRTFGGCKVGSATFTGTVTLTYNDGSVDNTCTMDSDADDISRDPDYQITGSNGGQYVVAKTGTFGQKITRVSAGVFNFTNDGIRRTVTFNSATLADFSTNTTAAIGITGANRNGRVAHGGNLRVRDNQSGVYCDYAPEQLTWGPSCNCPTSGQWSFTCSDGKSGSLAPTSCGSAVYTVNGSTQAVTFERCTST